METRRTGPILVSRREPSTTTAPTTTTTTTTTPTPTTPTPTTTTKPSTPKPPPSSEPTQFTADGATSKADTAKIATTSGGPVKGGVLGFLLNKQAEVLATGADIVARAGANPSLRALLAVRAQCPPQYAPVVEVVRADGSVVNGSVKGVGEDGHVVVDTGFGRQQRIPLDERLSSVRHQMDTDGDLHTALVTVFDQAAVVVDPWQLQGFVGKTLNVETFDAEHPSLAVAAKKGDVSGRPLALTGVSSEGLQQQGGTLLKEHWSIAKVTLEQPAYSYKKDGSRLSDVGNAIAAGTRVDVDVSVGRGGRTIGGVFRGMAKDAEGGDYLVVEADNGVRHAFASVVDVRAAAASLPLWQHADYASVYG
jgi:hypothetical protein